MTDLNEQKQFDLKHQVKLAFSSVSLCEQTKVKLRDRILTDSFATQNSTRVTLLQKIHHSGLGYLAAVFFIGFIYWDREPIINQVNSLKTEESAWEGGSIQGNKLNRLLPADFDLEGDYEALPSVVREVIGDRFPPGAAYEVKAPSKVRGNFSPGEGRFFAANKEHVGVSLRMKPQHSQWGTRAKTLFVLPLEVSGAEVKQVLKDQESGSEKIKDRIQKFVRLNRAMSEPHEKTIEELIDESNQEMGETLDARNGSASWKSGQFRYVLFDE
jgi:hypothetical protein